MSDLGPARFNPLPGGMRDLLPDQARRRRRLAEGVLAHLDRAGYHLVTLPAFEFTAVLERGLGTLDPAELLRFVEPESGQVAALRPDMTPQIARLVSTHLSDKPAPLRLCYEGTVVRRRSRRARVQRQLPQAGVELLGVVGLSGDLEVLGLLATSLSAAGLDDFILDLGHAGITRPLLSDLPGELGLEVSAALAHKDGARLERLVGASAHVPAPTARALVALADLHGGGTEAAAHRDGASILARGRQVLASTPAAPALDELADVWERARTAGGGILGHRLRLDLGEARGLSYYTGILFSAFADGPGEPVGAGGRYDDLLGRFGRPLPAVGFALNLDALGWALEAAGAPVPLEARLIVVFHHADRAAFVVEHLRRVGLSAISHAADDHPSAFARAWGYSHLVRLDGGPALLEPVAPGDAPRPLPEDPEALAGQVLAYIHPERTSPEGASPCPS